MAAATLFRKADPLRAGPPLPWFQLRKDSKEVEACPGTAAEVWGNTDAFPLAAADIVMLSNRIYPGVSALPAILDPVYVRHLRAAGFQDLVISDALAEISNQTATAVQALKSADVVLLASPEQGYAAILAVLSALRSGELNEDDICEKLHRAAAFRARIIANRQPATIAH